MIHEIAFTLDADAGTLHVDTSIPGTGQLFRRAGLEFLGSDGLRAYRGTVKDMGPEELYAIFEAIKLAVEFHGGSIRTPQISQENGASGNEGPKTGAYLRGAAA